MPILNRQNSHFICGIRMNLDVHNEDSIVEGFEIVIVVNARGV